ncbi:MAG: mannosyltransferase family protein [Planctomycetota bacterium]|nr:mannosyltransferase family protein [Planctomycetota bacterium]
MLMPNVPSPDLSTESTPAIPVIARGWTVPVTLFLFSRIWCISALYLGAWYFPVQSDFKHLNPRAGTYDDLPEYYRDYAAHLPEFGRYPLLGVNVGGRWSAFSPFVRWDALWYLSVVEVGYQADLSAPTQQNPAFFPVFPLAVRAATFLGVPTIPAAILLANLGTLVASCMLYTFARRNYGEPAARWSLLLWLFHPMGFFGSVPYADAFLAICTIAAMQAVTQQRHVLAGLWCGIATAVRPPALALAGLFIPTILGRHQSTRSRLNAFIGLCLSGVGIALFFAYLGYAFGDPLLYLHTKWYDPPSMSGLNPLRWLRTIAGGIIGIFLLLFRSDTPSLELYSGRVADPLLFVWALAWLPTVRRLGPGIWMFTLLACLMPLMSIESTASYGRYMWAVMPIFLAAGTKLANRPIGWITLTLFAAGQFILALWFGGGWVVI